MIARLGDRSIHVEVRRKQGLRNITIRITGDGSIRVSAPETASIRRLREAIESKRRWIEAKLDRAKAVAPYTDATRLLTYEGRRYRVERHASDRKPASVLFDESDGVVRVFGAGAEDLEELLRERLLSDAKRRLPPLAFEAAEQRGVRVERVFVRNQRTRWGSSSSRGNISLNWRLVMVPAEVREYLILHEIAHQRVMNHSNGFWRLVAQWCPEYRRHNAWLSRHGYLLSVLR